MNEPKDIFIAELKRLNTEDKFSYHQTKILTVQQRNFIRGIQITRKCDRKEGVRIFRLSQKSQEITRGLSDDIAKKYELGIDYQPPEPPKKERIKEGPIRKLTDKEKRKKSKERFKKIPGINRYYDNWKKEEISSYEKGKRRKIMFGEKPVKKVYKKQVYKYRGIDKRVTENQRNKFSPIKGKARRYTVVATGEEISRRERDKRLNAMWYKR